MNEPTVDKPLPEPTPESQPFWEGLANHQLVLQQCAHCGQVRHYPRPVCDECFSMETTWKKAKGRGAVHSWTVCHHAFHPGFKRELPYIVVTVDMLEGIRMIGQAAGLTTESLQIGLPVELDFLDIDASITLPIFRAQTAG